MANRLLFIAPPYRLRKLLTAGIVLFSLVSGVVISEIATKGLFLLLMLLIFSVVANRITRVANAKEALDMANSLDITYPTTLEALAQKSQKGDCVNAAIIVGDKQVSLLYLQGAKYLTTLIETLEKRESDEVFLEEINNIREKIYLIKNDQVLVALKKRESDNPWIRNLPEKLAQIDALKTLSPGFTSLLAYNMDESAIITEKKIKPKRKLIVVIGFVLSLFIAMIVASMKGAKYESN